MIETVTAVMGLVSAGIFIAHAFEGFRYRAWFRAAWGRVDRKAHHPPLSEDSPSGDSESFNQFGRASWAWGVPCATTIMSPTDSLPWPQPACCCCAPACWPLRWA